VKETYDDNVFAAGADKKYFPASFTVVPGSVEADKGQCSLVTTVSPKLAFNFIPLLGDQKVLQTLSLSYSPDFVIYHDESSENYNAHRFAGAIGGKVSNFSFNFDDSFAYIDGNDKGATYPGSLYSCYGVSILRERRQQIQDRANASLRYDLGKFFIRPVASLLYYDLQTDLINTAGYLNFADRYDVNGGVDLGYKVCSGLAVTAGYRRGHQYQEQFDFDTKNLSSPSDYDRFLVGVEGKPWKWLDFKLQGGPDFRSYEKDSPTHTTPLNNLTPMTWYGEGSLTATITPKDSIAFKFKDYQWVSSTGKVPYYESTYDLSYRRKVTDKLLADLGGRILTSDYTMGNLATCNRFDEQFSVTAGLTYNFNTHISAGVAYSLDLGRNAADNVTPSPSTREFDRSLISLSAALKF